MLSRSAFPLPYNTRMAQKSRLNCCHFYFAISNYEAQGKEKQDLIKLLNAAIASVQTSHDYASILAEYESKLTGKQRIGFYDKNPPPYPDFLDNMLSHSLTEYQRAKFD